MKDTVIYQAETWFTETYADSLSEANVLDS